MLMAYLSHFEKSCRQKWPSASVWVARQKPLPGILVGKVYSGTKLGRKKCNLLRRYKEHKIKVFQNQKVALTANMAQKLLHHIENHEKGGRL
jgi:hypothetical protein